MSTTPPAGTGDVLGPPAPPVIYGKNVLNKTLIGLSRDVPRYIRRAEKLRRGIRTIR